jgi:hypothetical protein
VHHGRRPESIARNERSRNIRRWQKDHHIRPMQCLWCGREFLPESFCQLVCSDRCYRSVLSSGSRLPTEGNIERMLRTAKRDLVKEGVLS